jgi:hypothetical protein
VINSLVLVSHQKSDALHWHHIKKAIVSESNANHIVSESNANHIVLLCRCNKTPYNKSQTMGQSSLLNYGIQS